LLGGVPVGTTVATKVTELPDADGFGDEVSAVVVVSV